MVLCFVCRRPVYPAEELLYQDKVYHKPCFKCMQCEKKLSLKTARSFDKIPYCDRHSPNINKQPTGPPVNQSIATAQTANVLLNTSPVHWRNTIHEMPSVPSERNSILACGYDTFQSQIELAGQVFTVDPVVRQNIFKMFNEFNIIVCGSARVGKSSLINAICGGRFAKTSSGLDSCTKDISRYVLNGECRVDNELITYTYNFWDTPGFESWNETDIRYNFNMIMSKPKSDPICMIYCASPGSFANTQQLKWLLDVCVQEYKLFCALVVTNKWAGQTNQRLAVLETYSKILTTYQKQTSEEDGIFYFGNVGLCTMINAQPYIDEENNINRDIEGVNELIEGIMACLDDDAKVFHWCMAVMQKKGMLHNFKGRMKQRFGSVKDFLVKKLTKK